MQDTCNPGGYWKASMITSQECRNWAWKAKALLKLHLLRDLKNKSGFYSDISSKRKAGKNTGLLLSGAGALETKNTERDGVVSAAFASVSFGETGLEEPQAPEPQIWWGRIRLGNL